MTHIVTAEYNLAIIRPLIAAEWHPLKNGILKPSDVAPKSHKKVWWKCHKGHEWEAVVFSRTNGNNCPNCSGQRVCSDNNLAFLNPELTKQWHPTKNFGLLPSQVTCGSNKKVWWICQNGHEWQTPVSCRATGHYNGCPKCNKSYSFIEMRIFSEFNALFGAAWHDQSFGVEIDVYVPTLKIAIEVDGSYWHKSKHDKDAAKNNLLVSKGLTVIRVREMPLKFVSKNDIGYSNKEDQLVVVQRLIRRMADITGNNFDAYIQRTDFIDPNKYADLVSKICFPTESIMSVAPNLVKEWHPTKNGLVKPDNVSYASHKPIWWICKEGHEWQASPSNRARGSKSCCPVCELKRRNKIDEEVLFNYLVSGMTYTEIEKKLGLPCGYAKPKAYLMRKKGFYIPKRTTGPKKRVGK